MNKYKYYLEGLSCANCAKKIEDKLLENYEDVTLDFMSKTLIIKTKLDQKKTSEKVFKIIKKIEPDIKISLEKSETANNLNYKLIRIIISVILFVVGLLLKSNFILLLLSYLVIGTPTIIKALKKIFTKDLFNENFLMTVASIGAFIIGEYHEAIIVMLLFEVGEYLQESILNKSRKSITDLMDMRSNYANLKTKDETKKVDPSEIKINDIIVIKPGEKIPLDGIIIKGETHLDTKALTGEAIPRKVLVGDTVISGSLNTTKVIEVKVTNNLNDSTVTKIIELIEESNLTKTRSEKFITKFAKIYTPIVLGLAFLLVLIPVLFLNGNLNDLIYRALVFLTIACPCALVISIPFGFFCGIGRASKDGILIKGSNYLEDLNKVETVLFDKTGTLTKGEFKVLEINPIDIKKEELLRIVSYGEYYSNHPIAKSIIKAYDKNIKESSIKDYKEISGRGIKATIDGNKVLIGNAELMKSEKIKFDEIKTENTIIYAASNKKYIGHLIIGDEIKEDAKNIVYELKKRNIKEVGVVSGDIKENVKALSDTLNLDFYYSDVLPNEKVKIFDKLKEKYKGNSLFVGDGLNDAPVLALADIGVAIGSSGIDAAIEAADVVIMSEQPSKILEVIDIAKKTRKIVIFNIVLSLTIKVSVLILGALGIASIWAAIVADVGVMLLTILNSIRILYMKH